MRDDTPWYKDAVIYEASVRAFYDTDGDGIGDLRGVTAKLDYLQDLGVTALWMLPLFPSPMRDDGYDIADYTNIDPSYGTLADFTRLVAEAHARNIRVITELVLNHTSDRHPWFQRARRARPGSRWRDFYVWSDTPDRFPEARIIFRDAESSNWTWDPIAGAYYWHRFYRHQPDLNFDNPHVRRAMLRVVDFWLSLGVDGMRLDAVPYLFERDGTNCEGLPETHEFLRTLRRHVDARYPDRMLIAEANQWPELAAAYFGDGDECHMAFHFPLMPRLFIGIHTEDRLPIVDILEQTPAIPATSQWALFLRNHDELTLEMVTDEERDYMYRVYARDAQARVHWGIRRRLAPLLRNNRRRIELMYALLFSLPGTPIVYYGDEIGMGDNIYLGDRAGVRTPMQWSADRNAGFSQANPQRLHLPVVIDPEYHYETVNVDVQQANPNALWWWMRRMIALRQRYRVFGRGSLTLLHPRNRHVLAFLRRWEDEVVLVVANLSRFVQRVELSLAAQRGLVPVEMIGRNPFPPIGDEPMPLTLGPHSFYWFELVAPVTRPGEAPPPPPRLRVRAEDVWRDAARARLTRVVAMHCGRGLSATPRFATIHDLIVVGAWRWCLIEIELPMEGPQLLAVPMRLASAAAAGAPEAGNDVEDADASAGAPATPVIAAVGGRTRADVLLIDGTGEAAFAATLLQAILRGREIEGETGRLVVEAQDVRATPPRATRTMAPTLVERTADDLVFNVDDDLRLTIRTVLRRGPAADVEVARFLAARRVPGILPIVGTAAYAGEDGQRMLAILRRMPRALVSVASLANEALVAAFEEALARAAGSIAAVPESPAATDGVDATEPAGATLAAFLTWADALGERLYHVHATLASDPSEPAFAPESFTTAQRRGLYQTMRARARRATSALEDPPADWPAPRRELAVRLASGKDSVFQRMRAIVDVHDGGEMLRTAGGLRLEDVAVKRREIMFPGIGAGRERWVPRAVKSSPLIDVASVLWSWRATARGARRRAAEAALGGSASTDALAERERTWLRLVDAAFLRGYERAAGGAAFLPSRPADRAALLEAFLVHEAFTDLLNARLPEWRVELALAALADRLA